MPLYEFLHCIAIFPVQLLFSSVISYPPLHELNGLTKQFSEEKLFFWGGGCRAFSGHGCHSVPAVVPLMKAEHGS